MPKYAQSKREFFHSGVDNQKRPDIVVDLKHPSVEQMKLWSVRQRMSVLQWIEDCEKTFKVFKKEITKAAK